MQGLCLIFKLHFSVFFCILNRRIILAISYPEYARSQVWSCPAIEMNITGTLPSDKLPIFFLKPNFTSRHACLEVKITRVYDMIDWLSALRMHEKTGHDNKGMSGHGFTFPGGGSVPVIFISMCPAPNLRTGILWAVYMMEVGMILMYWNKSLE